MAHQALSPPAEYDMGFWIVAGEKMHREINKQVQSALHGLGFRSTQTGFVRNSEFSSVILNVQPSSHGQDYFFNWGVFIHQLAKGGVATTTSTKLKHYDCHISMRLESFLSEYAKPLEAFAFFHQLGAPEKANSLAALHTALTSPEFKDKCEKCLAEAGIRALHRSDAFRHSLILKEARAFLEVRREK
jgi:hypothetical protein